MSIHLPGRLSLGCGPVGARELALFAAASGDHNLLHLDERVARSAGFEAPLVHGMFTMACAGRLFASAFGAARVQRLDSRFTSVATRGDVLALEAQLGELQGDTASYAWRALCGERVVASGTAAIAVLADGAAD